MEADDVVGEHPLEDRLADPPRQHPPAVGLCPGDVDEVVEKGVGTLGADHPGRRVEVVVVQHHQRPVAPVDLAQHRLGDVAVDCLVAVVPGIELLLADVGRVGEVPEVVLDEPEDRVRDHVVEAVVGLGVTADQQHPVVDPVDRELRRSAALLAHRDVLVGHRRGDPERVSVGDEAGERRHQSTTAPTHGALPGVVTLELSGPAIGDDDERVGIGHGSTLPRPLHAYVSSFVNSSIQSRSRRGERNSRRACSLPARPRRIPSSGSRRISRQR